MNLKHVENCYMILKSCGSDELETRKKLLYNIKVLWL